MNVKFNELMIDQQEMGLKEMQKVIEKGRNVIIPIYIYMIDSSLERV